MKKAICSLPSWKIELESLKPADPNVATFFLSFFLPWGKFFWGDDKDAIYLLVFFIVCMIYAHFVRDSYPLQRKR